MTAKPGRSYLAGHLGEPIRNFGVGGYGVYQAYLRMVREETTGHAAGNLILYIWGNDHNRILLRCRAYSVKDKVVSWLDPKPLTYRNRDEESVDSGLFEDNTIERHDRKDKMKNTRVASVQMESAAGNKEFNFGKVEEFARRGAEQSAAMVITPELSLTGYWFVRNLSERQLSDLAENVADSPSCRRLLGIAERYNVSVGAGLIESDDNGVLYNSYVVAMPDGKLACHRKINSFEHPCIKSGSEYTVFDTPHGLRAGVLICYDNNLIENVRITALRGAEILIAPHQTGGCRTRNPHLMGLIDRRIWENRHTDPASIELEFLGEKGRGWLMRWLPSRAHDSGLFLIFSNGVGVDDDEIRTGNAMVLDPYGRILAETHKADDDMVFADLDASLLEQATGRLWIQARRPELYRDLTIPTGLERDTQELKFLE